MSQQTTQTPGLDEAIAITVEYLRSTMTQPTGPRGNYGYDLWAPTVANAWALSACGTETLRRESAARRASPVFFEAAWELCRRGVLRPGIRETGAQAVSGGLGYSLTGQGREWLFSGSDGHFVMLQPGGLAAALATFRELFGEGYHQRSQEAVRCRDAEAWYSACAMVGAAAESIVLATAIAKGGSEATVLKGYGSANGQKKLLNDLAPATKPYLARPLATVTGLLAYWRDEASHGAAVRISGPETEQALRELLQLAQFFSENWDDLTLSPKAASAKAAAAAKGAEAVESKARVAGATFGATPAKAPGVVAASTVSTPASDVKTDTGGKVTPPPTVSAAPKTPVPGTSPGTSALPVANIPATNTTVSGNSTAAVPATQSSGAASDAPKAPVSAPSSVTIGSAAAPSAPATPATPSTVAAIIPPKMPAPNANGIAASTSAPATTTAPSIAPKAPAIPSLPAATGPAVSPSASASLLPSASTSDTAPKAPVTSPVPAANASPAKPLSPAPTPEARPAVPASGSATGPATAILPSRSGLPVTPNPAPAPEGSITASSPDTPADSKVAKPEAPAEPEASPAAPAVANSRRWW